MRSREQWFALAVLVKTQEVESQTSGDAELKLLSAGTLHQSRAVRRHVVSVVCRVDIDTKRRSCRPHVANKQHK